MDNESIIKQYEVSGKICYECSLYAGTGQKMGEQKERVNFGRIIGTYVNPETGEALETTKGIIHYGNKGAHIVLSRP